MLLLVLAPVIGARLIEEAYGGRGSDYEISRRTVALTRDAIDTSFRALLIDAPDRRRAWSELVREETLAGRLSSARGLLLAGPVVLDEQDAESLVQFARSSRLAGDDAVEEAALRYLADDARDAYERARRASQAEWLSSVVDEDATADVSSDEFASMTNGDATSTANANVSLNVLGDSRDLALEAARWVRGDDIDVFAFSLSGLGLAVLDPDARAGASVLRSAYRAHRLNPDLQEYFEDQVADVAPPTLLRRSLLEGFGGSLAVSSEVEKVEGVFNQIADAHALQELEADLSLINEIARKTTAYNAVTFLESARGYADLRRARLVAEAGGDKAIALARLDPTGVLHTAKTEIPWDNRMRLMLASLGAIAFVLSWLAVNTLIESFRRRGPRRRSAVYALEEPEWLTVDQN